MIQSIFFDQVLQTLIKCNVLSNSSAKLQIATRIIVKMPKANYMQKSLLWRTVCNCCSLIQIFRCKTNLKCVQNLNDFNMHTSSTNTVMFNKESFFLKDYLENVMFLQPISQVLWMSLTKHPLQLNIHSVKTVWFICWFWVHTFVTPPWTAKLLRNFLNAKMTNRKNDQGKHIKDNYQIWLKYPGRHCQSCNQEINRYPQKNRCPLCDR